MLQPGLDAAFDAALGIDKRAYSDGEPQRSADQFLARSTTSRS
jgi:hypothetical protein